MKSRASFGPCRSILEAFVFADNQTILGLVPVLECANIGTPGKREQQSSRALLLAFRILMTFIVPYIYTAHQNAFIIQEDLPNMLYVYTIPINSSGFSLSYRLIHDPQWVILFHGVRTQ